MSFYGYLQLREGNIMQEKEIDKQELAHELKVENSGVREGGTRCFMTLYDTVVKMMITRQINEQKLAHG